MFRMLYLPESSPNPSQSIASMSRQLLQILFPLLLLAACQKSEPPVFRPVAVSESGLDFTNEPYRNDTISILEFEYMFNGGGTALLDYDNDGWLDVFLTPTPAPVGCSETKPPKSAT